MKKNLDLILGALLIIYIIFLSALSGTKFAFSEGIILIAVFLYSNLCIKMEENKKINNKIIDKA